MCNFGGRIVSGVEVIERGLGAPSRSHRKKEKALSEKSYAMHKKIIPESYYLILPN